jgi:hypothetical protein
MPCFQLWRTFSTTWSGAALASTTTSWQQLVAAAVVMLVVVVVLVAVLEVAVVAVGVALREEKGEAQGQLLPLLWRLN